MIIRSRAPLRISFGGGGTDIPPYPELRGGCVISATINKYSYSSLKPMESGIKLRSLDYNLTKIFRSISELKYDGELDLVKATIKLMGIDRGFDLLLHTDAPPGSGLGSSSSVVVSMIGCFKEFMNKPMTSYEIADLAYRIERLELGIKGGLQDQYASTFGGFNFIEFKKHGVIVNPLRIKQEILNELELNLALFNLGTTRIAEGIMSRMIQAYKQQQSQTMEALDELKELAIQMKDMLLKGDLEQFGEILDRSWELKKKLDPKISNPEIDKIYTAGIEAGAKGGKLLGAGGGGHMIFYCDFDHKHELIKQLSKLGCSYVSFSFDLKGLQTWRI